MKGTVWCDLIFIPQIGNLGFPVFFQLLDLAFQTIAFFIKKGCWLQHRAHTLALWIMFIMTVPQFADRLAPVPTTHNPKAFFAVSFLSLVVNAAAVIYQFSVIRKNKLNPFKDEIYTDKAFYKKINAENK